MKSLLTHALAVFGLVGTMTVLINLQGCENNDDTIAKVQESDTYTTSQSEEYAELSEYLDSVSNAYDIDVTPTTPPVPTPAIATAPLPTPSAATKVTFGTSEPGIYPEPGSVITTLWTPHDEKFLVPTLTILA